MTPSPNYSRLGSRFFQRPTLEVARALLGKRLVRVAQGFRTSGLIVETEAYIGEEDLACHARAGRTARNAVMYGPSGHAYVYFVYGMHHCLNIVTEREGAPAAVLVRAIAPVEGIPILARQRGLAEQLKREMERRPPSANGPLPGPILRSLLNGPGKLCQALAIDRLLNGESLLGDRLFLERGPTPRCTMATPRIGVEYAGRWGKKPWRFLVVDSPWVSVRPPGRAAAGQLRVRDRPAQSPYG